jgi:hypothetical protein
MSRYRVVLHGEDDFIFRVSGFLAEIPDDEQSALEARRYARILKAFATALEAPTPEPPAPVAQPEHYGVIEPLEIGTRVIVVVGKDAADAARAAGALFVSETPHPSHDEAYGAALIARVDVDPSSFDEID